MRNAMYQESVEDLQEQYSIANIAVEAFLDDVMGPDHKDFKLWTDCNGSRYTISWKWRCYENKKSFFVTANLAANVKAYLFDLIIMTRNL